MGIYSFYEFGRRLGSSEENGKDGRWSLVPTRWQRESREAVRYGIRPQGWSGSVFQHKGRSQLVYPDPRHRRNGRFGLDTGRPPSRARFEPRRCCSFRYFSPLTRNSILAYRR
ncbi:hypothetical protein SPRG_20459 [Saprolegnia parasitica CBS 223.65]|uniref:Uncharacterized protein n=1 Tax=Saprolegnia parasitica (strain CBS 223.65) TaxID=695850 RepID=A0A067CKQ8_SAPPC|nr:hypothetical protein SPRG_20459 [Saprolegnia parasitica CBS 223.65]KDO27146.1 hypothetical protein SPRG_20459 [Saprolegnia parasitica CBS 223.65]|eukprot:XP_012202264.1 hypothetical protein SPRG_20459 [Saprolegnia parasitica CBS 223.65]